MIYAVVFLEIINTIRFCKGVLYHLGKGYLGDDACSNMCSVCKMIILSDLII